MHVVGTAGHVDHGKSTLVFALTGINPDRLQEEQDRQMTIDLGFAWMRLPGGEEIGIVDVPGHRDFIDNMLAGVGGIDAAILVIAADEGVMPQTVEHLAILDLLEVRRGVVALTKMDMVTDPEWSTLVAEDVRRLLGSTRMAAAPIVPVSARTGLGLGDLVARLEEQLHDATPRPERHRPRLPVDRVFSIAGFGTVVTGTLVDGRLSVGEEVEILPGDRRGRIRGLQTHKTKVGEALPGSRVAANLTGVAVDDIARGQVVVRPGSMRSTRYMDARIRMLGDTGAELRHNQEVRLYTGTTQVSARARLLEGDSLRPGEEGWVQFVLRDPIVVDRGDGYILRRPSPGATLGGGRIVEPHPLRIHRRRDRRVLASLQGRSAGSPGERLLLSLAAHGAQTLREAADAAGLSEGESRSAVTELDDGKAIIRLGKSDESRRGDRLVVDRDAWNKWIERATAALSEFHARFPLRTGMPREELRSRLQFGGRGFAEWIDRAEEDRSLVAEGNTIRLAGHVAVLNTNQQKAVDALMARFSQSPGAPPSIKECRAEVGDEVLGYLLELERLTQISSEVVFEAGAYRRMVEEIRGWLAERGETSVGEVRDRLGTSRKYALALMEHMDSLGITVREGDVRRLAPPGETRS
jgi:selenocysteine-specific elongation factor